MPIRVKPVSHVSNNSGSEFIKILFKYVRIIFLAGGIYAGNRLSTKVSKQTAILKQIFVAVVVVLFLTQACLFCLEIHSRARESQEYTRLLIFFIILTLNIFQSLFSSAILPKALADLEEEMTMYTERYKSNTGKYLNSRRVKVISIFSIVGTIVLVPVFLFYSQSTTDIICEFLPVCSVEGPVVYPLFLFNTMVFCTTTLQWLCFWLVTVFFSLYLLQEFKGVNILFQDSSIDPEELDKAISHHEAVIKVLTKVNACVQHYGFLGLFNSLPVNCFFLYTLFSDPVSTQDISVLFFAIGSALIQNFIRLLLEARVSSEAHGPLDYVWKFRKCNLSKQQFRKLELFIHRLTGDTIGYTIYGLITINMSTLLGIVGTLATYFIVALQFQPTSTRCSEKLANITYCVTSA